uniref:Uncharacterized protein n=1 Tax=Arion vulgaris TaxID=1028688 RepID=A0A0B6ZCI1_9EUPU
MCTWTSISIYISYPNWGAPRELADFIPQEQSADFIPQGLPDSQLTSFHRNSQTVS